MFYKQQQPLRSVAEIAAANQREAILPRITWLCDLVATECIFSGGAP